MRLSRRLRVVAIKLHKPTITGGSRHSAGGDINPDIRLVEANLICFQYLMYIFEGWPQSNWMGAMTGFPMDSPLPIIANCVFTILLMTQ